MMKKVLSVLTVVGLLLVNVLVSGTNVVAQAKDQLAIIQERGKLLVGTSPDFPPFEFYIINEEGDKEIVGSDMALAQVIADEIGVELEIVATDFNGVLANIQAGTIDFGIAGLSATKEREAVMKFSDGYEQEKTAEGFQGILMRKEDAGKYGSLDEIKEVDLIIACQGGSIQFETAQLLTSIQNIKQFGTTDSAMLALNAGDVDAVTVSSSSAEPMLATFTNLTILPQETFNLDPDGYYNKNVIGFPLAHDNASLIEIANKVIGEARENGDLEKWDQEAKEASKKMVEKRWKFLIGKYSKLREKVKSFVDSKIGDYMEIVQHLYDHPEIGNQEFETVKFLLKYLKGAGFETEDAYVVPTGFLATYDSGKPGPRIGYLCEFDALPEVGHGCGHNHIAATSIAAAEALKSVIAEVGGVVQVFGTPAEENFGGKVSMAEAGAFDDLDVALMLHPDVKNGLGGQSTAIYPLKFEFFGKNAHGCHPAEGVSALDAAVLTYVEINMLRQFVAPHTYIHGIVRDGGEAANVIPAYASLEYYFRAPKLSYAKEVADKAVRAAQGACLTTGARLETSIYECPYEDTLINYKLAKLLKEEFQGLGIEDIEAVKEVGTGSTDVGAVSYICPTIQGNIKIADESVQAHSVEMAKATLSDAGRQALVKGAQALDLLGLRLIVEPESLGAVKAEFAESKKLEK